MKVRTMIDPDTFVASISLPMDHRNKGECSVAKCVPIELDKGRIVLDINHAGQIIGLEIIDVHALCTPATIQELLEGP